VQTSFPGGLTSPTAPARAAGRRRHPAAAAIASEQGTVDRLYGLLDAETTVATLVDNLTSLAVLWRTGSR
jgi:hypothetical protein